MKKILFVNDEMCMGGVARVLNTLMAQLSTEKYEIDLLILHPHGELLDEVPEKVNILDSDPFFSVVDVSLSRAMRSGNIVTIVRKIYLVLLMKTGLIDSKIKKIRTRMNLKRYDVEFAAKEGFCTVFVANGDALRKLNWVLVDYKQFNYSKNHMGLLKESLKNIDMNIADSDTASESYKEVFGVVNIKTIHTLMDEERVRKAVSEPIGDFNRTDIPMIVSVGRFHYQKGMERLIIASIEAMKQNYEHILFLIGDGELSDELRTLAKDWKHITFLGTQRNPYNWIHLSDLFVLPSYYEGFATIVSESLIAGTPVLATEVAGIREQLTKREDGFIVDNDQESLNAGLIYALDDMEFLKECKKKLKTYHYPNEKILVSYEEEFDK